MSTRDGMRRRILYVMVGASLFLLSIFAYTRLTVGHQHLEALGQSRMLSNLIAFAGLLAALVFWSGPLKALKQRDVASVLIGGMLLAGVLWVSCSIAGVPPADGARFYLGRQVWWVGLVQALSILPLRDVWASSEPPPWRAWWGGGIISLGLGLALYVVGPVGIPGEMIAKVVLILVVPAASLVMTGIWYRGARERLLRASALLVACIPIAVVTIG